MRYGPRGLEAKTIENQIGILAQKFSLWRDYRTDFFTWP